MRFDMVVPVHLDSVLNALIIAVVLIAGCMMIVEQSIGSKACRQAGAPTG